MNRKIQEDINCDNPLHLFNEWEHPTAGESLKRYNADSHKERLPWLKTLGCCSCKSHGMPRFLEENVLESGTFMLVVLYFYSLLLYVLT